MEVPWRAPRNARIFPACNDEHLVAFSESAQRRVCQTGGRLCALRDLTYETADCGPLSAENMLLASL